MEPKFLADSMLGKLARWLILLGYDASYAQGQGQTDLELLEVAHREGRVFLTRDTKIPAVEGLRMIVVRTQRFEDQLKQLQRELGLKPDRKRLFTRCTYCNAALDELTREQALPLVPPLVRELKTPFFRCPSCKRMYWNGTHTERTIKKLEKLGL
ncbi:MAG: Mut7-C RNAse domain-containing protein [Elusimicrobia bacterium]|nr:Mut7-C RNAse domain-containing protein [Elusimicrobiota bacterium]